MADRNTVAGVVRAHAALAELKQAGQAPPLKVREGSGPGEYRILDSPSAAPLVDPAALQALASRFRLAIGARLVFADGTPDIIAYPADRAGWGRLCRLLTAGNLKAAKGDCILTLPDLLASAEGLLLITMPDRRLEGLEALLPRLVEAAPGAVWLGAAMHRRGDDRRRLAKLGLAARNARIPLLAVNDALYANPEDRDLQDVLTCIREGVPIHEAGRRLEMNAERHLKPPREMARLFRDAPEAIAETQHLLSRVDFSLDQLRYEYPDEPVPPGWDAQAWLTELTWRSAPMRYPDGVPDKVRKLLEDELALIGKLDYARYFLTIHDIVRFAEERGILCQGRGSAANSAVCYVLGITAVDPAAHDLLFARFISEERREPPDIDVDFEHERREEVIQHIYRKYGIHRAGIAATVISYRPKSAIRDVGKALGLTEDVTGRLAGTQWGSWGSDVTDAHVRQAGLDPANPMIRRAVGFATRLLGFPRHLSQHVGGFILTRGRLDELVPIGNAAMEARTFIEWDKDDIDALGLMKVDVLALGMLTCIRKALVLLKEHEGLDMGLADVPREEPAVYDMLCKGDSIGVFQVESRAQINMLPRLRPREFYDLVIQVAIVRPGPIQGDMVHPYLRRRAGAEPVTYPSPAPEHGPEDELYQVLNKTKGVPLFQEQAMKLAMVAAKFTDVEANQLRRAMATFRNVGTIGQFEALMVERMTARGYDREFAARCFEQIKGFGSYGFPESHAASFAKLVYVSSWVKCFHPAVFACALLNAQPMGFYAPAQIVRDAQEHGVEARPIDVNNSFWDNSLERRPDGALALRLGFRQIDGFHEDWGRAIERARDEAVPFPDPERLMRRADLPRPRHAAAGGRRRLPFHGPRPARGALGRAPPAGRRGAAALRRRRERAGTRRGAAGGAARNAPSRAYRGRLPDGATVAQRPSDGDPQAAVPAGGREERRRDRAAQRDGAWVRMAGVVLVRQRPGKGNAIFITLEDETGITNLVLWARLFERYRREVMGARLILAEGRVQRSKEGVIHLMAERIHDRTDALRRLSETHEPAIELSRADEILRPQNPRHRHPRDVRILPKSRDFH